MQNDKFSKIDLSVVVPLYNEQDNIEILYSKLCDVLKALRKEYELIFIDDGSSDGTYSLLKEIFRNNPRVQIVRLRKNFGQTAALACGFDFAKGEVIIAMDGDLQHDPADIPALIEKIEEGYDIVSGWRNKRVDAFFTRRLPSMTANKIMAILSGLKLHDFGTTFKAYRKEAIKDVELFGELHRFIPALVSWKGVSIAEVPIKNIVRKKGKSNYGLTRTIRVILDLILVKYLISYSMRPLRFFGLFGLSLLLLGSGIGIYLVVKKFIFYAPIMTTHGPLMMLGVLLIVIGIQVITFGLLAEMLTRVYHQREDRKIYSIAENLKH